MTKIVRVSKNNLITIKLTYVFVGRPTKQINKIFFDANIHLNNIQLLIIYGGIGTVFYFIQRQSTAFLMLWLLQSL